MLFCYIENGLKDLRLFFFLWIVLNAYRLIFMGVMQDYMEESSLESIIKSIFVGGELSLKTAGFMTLFSFAFVTLPETLNGYFKKKLPKVFESLREKIGFLMLFILTALFLGRFPYYKAFNSTYDWQIFMGLNDDVGSVLNMLFVEYGLAQMLIGAGIISYGLYRVLIKFLNVCNVEDFIYNKVTLLSNHKNIFAWIFVLAFTFIFFIFCRFGGAFSYSSGVNWENAGGLSDKFLNECMLDDGQAMYRAYSQEVRMADEKIMGVYPASIDEFTNGNLIKYLKKETSGARIEKPEHIFLIVGETFASWPLFEEYEYLGVGNYIKSLSKEENAFYYEKILPTGEYTAVALNGFITGLMDTGIRINYQPRSFEEPYITAFAPQMKKLGYNTAFWYGGTLKWDSMGDLAKVQGFDKTFGYPEFHAQKQNTWGANDKDLFNAIYESLSSAPPTVHLIMTTSNHPPYNMEATLPLSPEVINEKINNETLATELAYYNYMDKEIYDFIKKTYKDYPKSLFIVTGDHAVRMLPSNKPTNTELTTVPLLFYGYGINQKLFNKAALPMHNSILPTIIELIAEKNHEYYSITTSLFEKNDIALMNKYYWDGGEVKKLYKPTSSAESAYESFRVKTISYYLLKH